MMKYRKIIDTCQQNNPRSRFFWVGFLLLWFLCVIGVGVVSAQDLESGPLGSGPDIAILDASVKMDISDMGDIPLGTIPEERLIVTITIRNMGNREVPGFKIKAYLVRVGREDEIGTQIGGDVTDTRLGAGETRVYTKSWSLPTNLKIGSYKVMAILDTSNYFIEPDTDNNRFISQQEVFPGTMNGPRGAIPVYSPAEIKNPGYYVLKRDIDGGKKNNIFEIKCSGVTFDGGGNTIRGSSSDFTTGIFVDAGSAIRDITIKNLNVENVDTGIWMYKASNGIVTDCTFRNTKNMGLRLDQSNQNEITRNVFAKNLIGIGIFQSAGNLIYNNLFKNKENAAASGDQRNRWNVDLVSGANIIGGSIIGGNAWFDESGEGGFSATAPDDAHDGISDTPYPLNPSNIDLYPLSSSPPKQSLTMAPVPTETPGADIIPEENALEGESNIAVDTPEPEPVPTPQSIPAEDVPAKEPVVNQTPDEKPAIITPISPHADMSVKEITCPDSSCPGSDFSLSAIIENTGGYDADSFQVRFYLTGDKLIDSGDIFLGEKTVQNILSGSEQTITESFTIPKLIGLKNYYLAVVTNTDNSVFEDKKENNTGFSSERMTVREC